MCRGFDSRSNPLEKGFQQYPGRPRRARRMPHPHRPPHLRAASTRRAKQYPPSGLGGPKFLPGGWEPRVAGQRGAADFPAAFERRPVAAAGGRPSSLIWETLRAPKGGVETPAIPRMEV